MNDKPHRGATGRRCDPAKEEFWRETLARWLAGGRSVRGFCRAEGLSEPSFYAWRRELARRNAAAARPTPKALPAFVPVRVSDPASAGAGIQITLAGGVRIDVRGPVDRHALGEVLAALRSVPGAEEEA